MIKIRLEKPLPDVQSVRAQRGKKRAKKNMGAFFWLFFRSERLEEANSRAADGDCHAERR